MSAPRWSRIRSRPARRRSHRFWRAATRELRDEISSAISPSLGLTGYKMTCKGVRPRPLGSRCDVVKDSYFLSSITRARVSVVPIFSVLCDPGSDQVVWPDLSSRSSVLPSANVYFVFPAVME
jgi:hypothetical protein